MQGQESRDLDSEQKQKTLSIRANQLCQLLNNSPKAQSIKSEYQLSPGGSVKLLKI